MRSSNSKFLVIAIIVFVLFQLFLFFKQHDFFNHHKLEGPISSHSQDIALRLTPPLLRNVYIKENVSSIHEPATIGSIPTQNEGARIYEKQGSRVAVLIPYIGSALPSWFSTYIFSAEFSSDLFDYFIIMIDDLPIDLPSNVKIIKMSESELLDRVLRMDNKAFANGEKQFNDWKHLLEDVFHKFPYMLVEFKPCLGYLFQV
jgi:hypothetical protein